MSDYEKIDLPSTLKNMATPEEEEEDGPIWVFQDRSPLIPPELHP